MIPRLHRDPVALPPFGGASAEVWTTIGELAHRLTCPWAVVGGQMVLLHGLKHGAVPPRVSTDVDAAVDVRADPNAVRRIVTALTEELGFDAAGVSPDGHAHRFERATEGQRAVVDVMAGSAPKDRRRLRSARASFDNDHGCWSASSIPHDAQMALATS